MPVFPLLRRCFPYVILSLVLLFVSCGPSGSSGAGITVRLAPGLPEQIAESTIELIVVPQDPNLVWCEVKLFPRYSGMNELVARFLEAVDSVAISRRTLETSGRDELDSMPPGRYWVITASMVSAGDERLLWSLPLVVDSINKQPRELVMRRSNAALVLGPEDTGL